MKAFRCRLCSAMLMATLLAAGPAAAVEFAVQSRPAGARIIIDQREHPDRTPAIIDVEPGDHDLTLSKEGYQSVTRRLQVSGRGFASFELPPLDPSPSPGSLPGPARTSPAPAPITSSVPARPGDFGPAVTIRYRRPPSGTPAASGGAALNLLPADHRYLIASAPPQTAPTEAGPAALGVAGPLAAPPPELDSPEVFAAEFLAAIETELGEEALLLRETSDPDFAAGDPATPVAVDTADIAAFGADGATAEAAPDEADARAVAFNTVMTPAVVFGEEPEPPPAPPPSAPPYCAPEPEIWWPSSAEDRLAQAAAGLPVFPDKFNVLLLGLDRRDRRGILATGAEIPLERLRRIPARSDVIMVFQFDFNERRVRLVSIPRDTRVKWGRGGGKINAAYAFGREKLARRVVENFLDLPIHRVVVVDWRAAKQCIALYKGLDLDYGGFDEKEMFWHLRKRSFARGDFQRIERQQRFLAGAWREFLRLSRESRTASGPTAAVTREMLALAMEQAYQTVETDLSWDEVRILNYVFRDYDPDTMVMTQVPGVGILGGNSAEPVYYLAPVSRHSFDDLIARAEGNRQQ